MAIAKDKKKIENSEPSQNGGAGWFQVGMTGVQEELARQELRDKRFENRVRRHWMPANSTKDIIFVDGNYNGDRDPFTIREHNFPPKYRDPRTCLRGVAGVI